MRIIKAKIKDIPELYRLQLLAFAISILCVLSMVGCGSKATNNSNTEKPYTGAPKIVLDGHDYFTKETVILNELPEGYSYAGELTDQEKEFACIDGEKYYLPDGVESIEDFYVYQECGTPVSDHEIDNTKRQWAYVKWSLGQ